MVKSTVRFPEGLVDEIETLVSEGKFESKSDFHRFASDYLLDDIVANYQPKTLDYGHVKAEVVPETQTIGAVDEPEGGLPFFASVSTIRRYALRGAFRDAEDFIDDKYAPNERDALLLEELLDLYRFRATARRQPDE
jgi:hypothetical protein